MDRPLLEVEDLQVALPLEQGLLQPVRGVDFQVARGETLAIVGESGCGKSITAMAVIGLLPKAAQRRARRLDFAGRSLLDLAPRELQKIRGRHIATVFQDPMTALNPSYTIGNQLVETLRQHCALTVREAERQALEQLGLVGIPAPEMRLRQFPHQLSGGLRQRVAIAMALSCQPELLIADEPTTALDVTLQAQVLQLLRSLQQRSGLALVLITHDLGVVAGIADRALVMYAGQVVEQGPVAELFAAPAHPYTVGLMRALPGQAAPGQPLGTIPGVVPMPLGELRACGFAPRCAQAQAACVAGPVPFARGGAARDSRCVRATAFEEVAA